MAEQNRQNALHQVQQLNGILYGALPPVPQQPQIGENVEQQRHCANYIAFIVERNGRELWPLLNDVVFTDLNELADCGNSYLAWMNELTHARATLDLAEDRLFLLVRKQFSAFDALRQFIYELCRVCIRCALQLSQRVLEGRDAPPVARNQTENEQKRQRAMTAAQTLSADLRHLLQPLPGHGQFDPTHCQQIYKKQLNTVKQMIFSFMRRQRLTWRYLDGVNLADVDDLDDATVALNRWKELLEEVCRTLQEAKDRLFLAVQKKFEVFSSMQEFINQLCYVISRIMSCVGRLARIVKPDDVPNLNDSLDLLSLND